MDDRLVSLLRHFELRARLFHSGVLCRSEAFDRAEGLGYVHVLRRGRLRLSARGLRPRTIAAPSVIFMPAPHDHRLVPQTPDGVDLVCASMAFGSGVGNPLTRAVPAVVVVPLADGQRLAAVLELLFAEAEESHCGRQAIVDRLAEVAVVLLFRHLMDAGLASTGILAGLADARLMKALNAMHDAPAEAWTLERLAAVAGMSRARFAARFREVVDETPAAYLASWRVSVAQTLLGEGYPVNVVAGKVGYESPSALARVFTGRVGQSPTAWARARRAAPAAA